MSAEGRGAISVSIVAIGSTLRALAPDTVGWICRGIGVGIAAVTASVGVGLVKVAVFAAGAGAFLVLVAPPPDLARPESPSRWTLPITAFRVTLPSSPAIWLALNPSAHTSLITLHVLLSSSLKAPVFLQWRAKRIRSVRMNPKVPLI